MTKPNNKSQVFVRTFVAGTIALSVVSAPSFIMANEAPSTSVAADSTNVEETPVVTNEQPAAENTAEPAAENTTDPAAEDTVEESEQAAGEETAGEEAAGEETAESTEETPAPVSNERPMDAEALNEIIAGERTFDNGTLDLRLFDKNAVLEVGRDTDEDGILDEAEVIVYERGDAKHFKFVTDPLKADSDGDGLIDSEDPHPLTWDVSARDAYMFAKLSYREDDQLNKIFTYDQATVEEAFEVHDPKNANNVPEVMAVELGNKTFVASQRELARYWRPVLTMHENSGLDAVLFEFNNELYPYLNPNGTYVLAFRGTDPSGDGDKTDDGLLGFGRFTYQGEDIVKFNKDLVAKTGKFSDFDIKSLSVTGHSLGGYLSQVFLADIQGGTVGTYKTPLHSSDMVKGVYTFNAAPIIVRDGWFSSSPQNVRDLKDAGEKLNAAHTHNPDNPAGTPEHRHFVINGEIITNMTGGFKGKEEIGSITSTKEGDNPSSTQAHYLSNFAREQYAPIFDQGVRKGFNEMDILPLATGIDGYKEVDFIGKVKPCTLTIQDAEGVEFFKKTYTLKGFNTEIERLNNTGRYTCEVAPQNAVFKLKETPVYKMLETDGKATTDLVYTVGEDTLGVFVSDGPATLLTEARLDGRKLNNSEYTIESGSTIARVNKEVMDELPNGEHKFELFYADGGDVDR